jgi:hypothetical protein
MKVEIPSWFGTGNASTGNVPAVAKFLSTYVTYFDIRGQRRDAAITSTQIVRIRMS